MDIFKNKTCNTLYKFIILRQLTNLHQTKVPFKDGLEKSLAIN